MAKPGSPSDPKKELPPALSTKVEEDFVAPLTAIRGVLEILRDFPDLDPQRRANFISSALDACGRLEDGVSHLAEVVYAAAQKGEDESEGKSREPGVFGPRLHLHQAEGIAEVDLSGLEFSSNALVNAFFDFLDQSLIDSGKQWYLMTNTTACRIWPEAWVSFAHRTKKTVHLHCLGTARYELAEDPTATVRNPDIYPSREAAIQQIERLKTKPRWS